MFSKTCEYGIKAALFIAANSLEGKRISLKSIVAEINTPEAFTAKILQQLTKAKIITSNRGSNGGFSIPINELDSIKISQIVTVLDGEEIYTSCGLGMKNCNDEQPCPLHRKFKNIRTELKEMLENTNLLELMADFKNGNSFLKYEY
jgi:Rrf2 family protein